MDILNEVTEKERRECFLNIISFNSKTFYYSENLMGPKVSVALGKESELAAFLFKNLEDNVNKEAYTPINKFNFSSIEGCFTSRVQEYENHYVITIIGDYLNRDVDGSFLFIIEEGLFKVVYRGETRILQLTK